VRVGADVDRVLLARGENGSPNFSEITTIAD